MPDTKTNDPWLVPLRSGSREVLEGFCDGLRPAVGYRAPTRAKKPTNSHAPN
ncbi:MULTISPECIES: hypothetical protein [Nostoc]|uniref:hypothetical protein n=1 Tax=Nostoc TaxID=1177 RepID=UPI001F55836B|nr:MULTISPECIES: hypothetical protein [Nostoc]